MDGYVWIHRDTLTGITEWREGSAEASAACAAIDVDDMARKVAPPEEHAVQKAVTLKRRPKTSSLSGVASPRSSPRGSPSPIEKRPVKTVGGRNKDARTKVIRSTVGAVTQVPTEVLPTPLSAAACGKRTLSPASALVDNRPARRLVVEMQSSRAASVLASLLELEGVRPTTSAGATGATMGQTRLMR